MRKWFCILQCKAMGPSSIQFDFPQLSFLWMEGRRQKASGRSGEVLIHPTNASSGEEGRSLKSQGFLKF